MAAIGSQEWWDELKGADGTGAPAPAPATSGEQSASPVGSPEWWDELKSGGQQQPAQQFTPTPQPADDMPEIAWDPNQETAPDAGSQDLWTSAEDMQARYQRGEYDEEEEVEPDMNELLRPLMEVYDSDWYEEIRRLKDKGFSNDAIKEMIDSQIGTKEHEDEVAANKVQIAEDKAARKQEDDYKQKVEERKAKFMEDLRKRSSDKLAKLEEYDRLEREHREKIGVGEITAAPHPLSPKGIKQEVDSRRISAEEYAKGVKESMDVGVDYIRAENFRKAVRSGELTGGVRDHFKRGGWDTSMNNRVSAAAMKGDRNALKELMAEDVEINSAIGEKMDLAGTSVFEKGIKGAAGSAQAMAEGIGVGALAGSIPFVGPVTGKAAAGWYWQQQGAGTFLRSFLRNKDIDAMSEEELAQANKISQAMAVPYAIIEFAVSSVPGAKSLGSGIDQQIANLVFRKVIANPKIIQKMTRGGVKFGIRWLMESLVEEGYQGGVESATMDMLDAAEGGDKKSLVELVQGINWKKMAAKISESGIEAMPTTFVTTAAGGAVSAAGKKAGLIGGDQAPIDQDPQGQQLLDDLGESEVEFGASEQVPFDEPSGEEGGELAQVVPVRTDEEGQRIADELDLDYRGMDENDTSFYVFNVGEARDTIYAENMEDAAHKADKAEEARKFEAGTRQKLSQTEDEYVAEKMSGFEGLEPEVLADVEEKFRAEYQEQKDQPPELSGHFQKLKRIDEKIAKYSKAVEDGDLSPELGGEMVDRMFDQMVEEADREQAAREEFKETKPSEKPKQMTTSISSADRDAMLLEGEVTGDTPARRRREYSEQERAKKAAAQVKQAEAGETKRIEPLEEEPVSQKPAVSETGKPEYSEMSKQEQNNAITAKEVELLKKTQVDKDGKVGEYALSSVADGALLRKYTADALQGKITDEQAVAKIDADYQKMKKTGEVEAEPKPQETPDVLQRKTTAQAKSKAEGKKDVPAKKEGKVARKSAKKPTKPPSIAKALNDGTPVKMPKTANGIKVTTKSGGIAHVSKADIGTLKAGGPYKSAVAVKAPKFTKGPAAGELDWSRAVEVKEKITVKEETKVESAKTKAQLEKTVEPESVTAEADRLIGEAQTEADKEAKGGFVYVDETGAKKAASMIKRAWANFYGSLRVFGKSRVLDPKLGEKAQEVYYQKLTNAERSILEVHQMLQTLDRRSPEEGLAVTFAYEEGRRADLPDNLKPMYDMVERGFTALKEAQQAAGVLGKGFPQSAIDEANRKIAEIVQSPVFIVTKQKQLQALRKELVELERIKNYLPHGQIAKYFMETALKGKSSKTRRMILKELRTIHNRRKGRLLLRDYLNLRGENGKLIFSPHDFDVGRLLMDSYVDANLRVLNAEYSSWLRDNGYLIPKNVKVDNPDDYIPFTDLPPAAQIRVPGNAANYKIHRLAGESLQTLSKSDAKISNVFDKILSISKSGQFIHGGLIVAYNELQRMYGGGYVNPATHAKNLGKAVKAVAEKDDIYKECLEQNVYQEPVLTARSGLNKTIEVMSRQTQKGLTSNRGSEMLRRWTERVTGETYSHEAWKKKGIVNDVVDAAMVPMKAIATGTWTADRIQRTNTYLNLRDMGLAKAEAAEQTARMHGAYSKIGPTYRKYASRIAFVYSFRLLMPLQTVRGYTDIAKFVIKKATGKEVSNAEGIRSAKALVASVLIPTAIDAALQLGGWKPVEEEDEMFKGTLGKITRIPIGEGKYRIIIALPNWKYKREYTDAEGNQRELVIGVNNIANMITKWAHRFSAGDIKNLDTVKGKTEAVLRWEFHPLYHHFADFWNNETSYGGGRPRGADGKDFVGGTAYLLKNTFRLYGTGFDMINRISGKEPLSKKQRREELENQLNIAEKLLFGTTPGTGVSGYAYSRGSRAKAADGYARSLRSEIKRMIRQKKGEVSSEAEFKEEEAALYALLKRKIDRLERVYKVDLEKHKLTDEERKALREANKAAKKRSGTRSRRTTRTSRRKLERRALPPFNSRQN